MNDIAQAIEKHQQSARLYLQLASDSLAVAMQETRTQERRKEYLGYSEDYSLYAHKELTKAYRLLSNKLHEASLPVNQQQNK